MLARERDRAQERATEQGWHQTLHDQIPAMMAGGELYEPSQPAPRHHPLVYAVILTLAAIAVAVTWVRRLRNPVAMAVFAVIIAAVAIFAVRGG
jgi:uncharacterized membrane protein